MLSAPVSGPNYPPIHPSCGHPAMFVLGLERNSPFCGLCYIKLRFDDEVPGRVHEYKQLADNGNPQTDPRLWAHLEAVLGLVPPKPGQNLKHYRLARGRLYGEPSKNQFPVTRALWELMGVQPKLATPVVRSVLGASWYHIASELGMTRFGVHTAMAKGIRSTLRIIRSNG